MGSMTKLPKITNKYKKENWLFGQFIPVDLGNKLPIIFLGEKPSNYFIHHPARRYLGNYNATPTDKYFQEFIGKYFPKNSVYVTDMVKTEGVAGANFENEWRDYEKFLECLIDEIETINPKVIVCMSKRTEKLFSLSFPHIKTLSINHPSYVYRWKNRSFTNGLSVKNRWEEQFLNITKELNK